MIEGNKGARSEAVIETLRTQQFDTLVAPLASMPSQQS
jgi:hypothetical protein